MASLPVFWGHPLSFATQKGLLGLEEKHVAYEYKKINILLGENFRADYIKLNNNATIPTFITGDQTITDSTELLKYLDSQGEPLGGDKVDRTKVEGWYERQTAWDDNAYTFAAQGPKLASQLSDFRQKVLEARKAEHPELSELYEKKQASLKKLKEKYENPAVVEGLHKQLIEILDVAEGQLSQTPFVAGEAFSMADVVLMTVLNRVEGLKKTQELIDPKPALSKYWTEAKTRPGYKKAMGPGTGIKALPSIFATLVNITIKNLFKHY